MGDSGSTFSLKCARKAGCGRDNTFLSTVLDELNSRENLGPHASCGKMSFIIIFLHLSDGGFLQRFFFFGSEVDGNIVDLGKQNQPCGLQFGGDQP